MASTKTTVYFANRLPTQKVGLSVKGVIIATLDPPTPPNTPVTTQFSTADAPNLFVFSGTEQVPIGTINDEALQGAQGSGGYQFPNTMYKLVQGSQIDEAYNVYVTSTSLSNLKPAALATIGLSGVPQVAILPDDAVAGAAVATAIFSGAVMVMLLVFLVMRLK